MRVMTCDHDCEAPINASSQGGSIAGQPLFVVLPTAILMGMLFGISFQKSHVFEPYVIRGQFIFARWVLMKIFLVAAGTSLITFSILYMSGGWIKERFEQVRNAFSRRKESNIAAEIPLLRVGVGTSILGAGMAIGGACPGMVLAQIGSGVSGAWVTLLGCLSGALVFGFLESRISALFQKCGNFTKIPFIDEYLKKPFHYLAIPMGVMMILIAVMIEILVPWTNRLDEPSENASDCTFFGCETWPPQIGGLIIGLLQIPGVIVMFEFLGGSRGYVTIVSQWVNVSPSLTKYFGYLGDASCGMKNWWQVLYLGCSILGAYLSALASNSYGDVEGLPAVPAFLGGFCLVFGARIANGCTSGHGLSGMGMLTAASIAGVMCMFGTAVVVGLVYWLIAPEGAYYKAF